MKLDKCSGEPHFSIRPDYTWFQHFLSCHMSTSDTQLSEHLVAAISSEVIYKIFDQLMNDRKLKVREIAYAVGISGDRVHNILQQHLECR